MSTLKTSLKEHMQKIKALDGILLPVGEGSGVEPYPTATSIAFAKPQPKKRGHKPQHARLYARIREIPRTTRLKEFCKHCDQMQIYFPVPKHLVDQGCPQKWLEAWKVLKWRQRIHNLRQNAWRPKNLV